MPSHWGLHAFLLFSFCFLAVPFGMTVHKSDWRLLLSMLAYLLASGRETFLL